MFECSMGAASDDDGNGDPRLGVGRKRRPDDGCGPGAIIRPASHIFFPVEFFHENSRSHQAGRRFQRQGPGQAGWYRRRYRQRQDVDEPLRRDRGRGGGPAEGKGCGDRDCRSFLRNRGVPGDAAYRAGAGRRPGDAGGDGRRVAAARGGEAPAGDRRPGAARPRDSRQAGDRRRCQPDGPDAGGAPRLAAGDVRFQGGRR